SFREPTQSISGELNILLWSHFVPAHDSWFDPFAKAWGEQVGVTVNIDHINTAEVPAATPGDGSGAGTWPYGPPTHGPGRSGCLTVREMRGQFLIELVLVVSLLAFTASATGSMTL